MYASSAAGRMLKIHYHNTNYSCYTSLKPVDLLLFLKKYLTDGLWEEEFFPDE